MDSLGCLKFDQKVINLCPLHSNQLDSIGQIRADQQRLEPDVSSDCNLQGVL